MQCSVLFQVKPNWRMQHRPDDKINLLLHCSSGFPGSSQLGNLRQQKLSWRGRAQSGKPWQLRHTRWAVQIWTASLQHTAAKWRNDVTLSRSHASVDGGSQGEVEGSLHRLERVSFYLMHQSTSAKRERGWFFPARVMDRTDQSLKPRVPGPQIFCSEEFPSPGQIWNSEVKDGMTLSTFFYLTFVILSWRWADQ